MTVDLDSTHVRAFLTQLESREPISVGQDYYALVSLQTNVRATEPKHVARFRKIDLAVARRIS